MATKIADITNEPAGDGLLKNVYSPKRTKTKAPTTKKPRPQGVRTFGKQT